MLRSRFFAQIPAAEVLWRNPLARTVLLWWRRLKAALIFESLSFLCERISREVLVLVSTLTRNGGANSMWGVPPSAIRSRTKRLMLIVLPTGRLARCQNRLFLADSIWRGVFRGFNLAIESSRLKICVWGDAFGLTPVATIPHSSHLFVH